jgi:hypothetical protein
MHCKICCESILNILNNNTNEKIYWEDSQKVEKVLICSIHNRLCIPNVLVSVAVIADGGGAGCDDDDDFVQELRCFRDHEYNMVVQTWQCGSDYIYMVCMASSLKSFSLQAGSSLSVATGNSQVTV